jgi:hypothetical protein
LASPVVYVAVILCAPAAVNDLVRVAVPLAFVGEEVLRPDALTGTTEAVPMDVPPAEKVTVPVGPTPLLVVPMAAVKVTFWPTGTVVALDVTPIVVGPGVIVTASAGEVLAVKLLSPE